MKKWLWEYENYPSFPYQAEAIIKVLNKLLEYSKDEFEGGLSTKKYMSITKVSKPTAFRDMQELVTSGYIQQIEGTAGRNVIYELVL